MAGPNGEPISPHTGRMASVSDPTSWGSFEDAVRLAERSQSLPGFILSASDPYCIIDLDNKVDNPATPEELVFFGQLLAATPETYSEVSRSGRGYHIVMRGSIADGVGRRQGHVEIYDRSRFMIFTGNSNSKPICGYQPVIDLLLQMLPRPVQREVVSDGVETMSDLEVVEMGLRASNGDKFAILTAGPDLWKPHYPSQSEADYALLGMLWFYSRNVEQVVRIFRASPLGQREKAYRNEYVLGAIDRIRAAEPPLVDISIPVPVRVAPEPVAVERTFRPAPGFVGRLAEDFYQQLKMPVREIATVAALGAITGLVSRPYNVSGTGLNLYLFLLAETGRGKEGIHDCINGLFNELGSVIPGVSEVIGPSKFASSQAVIKTLSRKPQCLSLVGEFGLELEQMTSNHNPQKNGVKAVWLDVFNKSGKNSTLHGSAYADAEKNVSAIKSPCLTIIGECTPTTYYKGMELANIEEGLIPRFLSVTYAGKRMYLNENRKVGCDPTILRHVGDIACASLSLTQSSNTIDVTSDVETTKLLREFGHHCTDKINESTSTLSAELWNRVHFKTLRVSAILAVADNPHNPVITREHFDWAKWLVTEDLEMTMEKFEAGDIGQGDAKQIADLRRAIGNFFTTAPNELVTAYAVPADLLEKRLVPYIYLQRRTSGLASFKSDRLGATAALKRAVEELIATGEIQEIARSQGHVVGYTGRLFFVKG